MLPVYVINLDRRPDRWQAMAAQLDRLGIEAERIPAIDREELAGDPALLRLGAGHVACVRSHYKAMQALVDRNAPAALILEDDVEIGEQTVPLIASPDWWPGEHGLVKLESWRAKRTWLGAPECLTPDGRPLRRILHRYLGAAGYLIDYDAALEVLEVAPAAPMPMDHLLFDIVNSPLAYSLRPMQMVPGAIRQQHDLFGSETGESRVGGSHHWKAGLAVKSVRKLPLLWAMARGQAEKLAVGYRP